MKYIYSFIISLFFFLGSVHSQCDTSINKIMMVGDSWAKFSFDFGSFPTNLDRFGFTNIGMYTNNNLSINGAVTSDFLTTAGKTAIQDGLTNNPNIEWVNLSIGGNDILNNWNNSMDSITTDSLLDATMLRTDSIIQFIKSIKPSVKIYIPGYDFANFGEVIMTFTLPSAHPFYSRWNGMGKPSFIEINKLLTKASVKFDELANRNHNLFYTSALGLMQYIYGQTTPLGIAPGGTYLPKSVPLPGGRLDYPTPKIMMNDYVVFKDCFHLSDEGFEMFYKYHFENYFWDQLRSKKNITIDSEGGNKDGGITSISSILPANVTVGNNSTIGISKGIISFNTSPIPSSTIIHKANIFLHRDNLTGTLPSFNKIIVEVKNGNFGTTSLLEIGDYSSTADKTDTACVYGTVKENGYWLRIELPISLLNEINTSGTTQYRLSMIDSTDGSTLYYSTGDSTNKPFIDLEYFNPVSITNNQQNKEIYLFPNPSHNNFITVTNLENFEGNIIAIDIMGRQFPLSFTRSQLYVSKLSQGTYVILFKDENSTYTKRFVKL